CWRRKSRSVGPAPLPWSLAPRARLPPSCAVIVARPGAGLARSPLIPQSLVVPARIVSIQLCPGHRQPMQLVPTATLITGVGIEGDKHAAATSDRQVLL